MNDSQRRPGIPWYADRPAGTDQAPEIGPIVVVMKENHSFDHYFGMLGRGDGFSVDSTGAPTNSNPDREGRTVTAHHQRLPLNPSLGVSQTWNSSHRCWNHGAMDGFVITTGSAAPMGYLDGGDLPWYYSLARTFGIGDRYFASCLAQTFPNRRFLQAGTADGLVATSLLSPFARPPASGTIWDRLDDHRISWTNYFVEVPEVALWPRNVLRYHDHLHGIDAFFADCAVGRLPAVSLVTPDIPFASEGEFEDDQIGEAWTARIFDAVTDGPQWPNALFVLVWDEGGGFYDHVPPPPAPVPDGVAPAIRVPPDEPGAYDRYGFRVPCIVASPFSRPGHVSSVVYDHTSILATIESKWNLAPLTARDAAATPLWDFVDLAVAPSFVTPPLLERPTIWPFDGRR